MKIKLTTHQILKIMEIFAWIAFIGYCIQCGAYLVSYIVSWFNPREADDIINGLDLTVVKEYSFTKYSVFVACIVLIAALKANIWYKVTQIIPDIKIENPFTIDIARRLEKISSFLLSIWIVGYISNIYADWLLKSVTFKFNTEILRTLDSGEFLFMAGLLFIVSQIFKRGVELQSENDLTV